MALSEKEFEFYLEDICPRGDEVLRLAYLLILNKQAAWQCVSKTFDKVLDKLPSAEEDLQFFLVQNCWQAFKEQNSWPTPDTHAFTQAFAHLNLEERSALAAVDVCGLNIDSAAKALARETTRLRQDLSQARQKLLSIEFV